jgi:hypothetical protein
MKARELERLNKEAYDNALESITVLKSNYKTYPDSCKKDFLNVADTFKKLKDYRDSQSKVIECEKWAKKCAGIIKRKKAVNRIISAIIILVILSPFVALLSLYIFPDATLSVLGKVLPASVIDFITEYRRALASAETLPEESYDPAANHVQTPEPSSVEPIIPEPIYGTVRGITLNLRDAPSLDSNIIATLPEGTVVEILEDGEEWLLVSSDGREGYVSADYIVIE